MSNQTKIEPLTIFELCNVELKDIGTQHKGDCPLCGKTACLFVNPETGQWDCKKCMEGGNIYTWMRKWYELTREDFDPVATAKVRPGIGKLTLAKCNIGYDGDSWIIPSFQIRDGEIKVKTLRRWTENPKEIKTFKGTKSGIYIAQWTDNTDAKVWVCEGEWDALAWLRIVEKVQEDDIILAVPGAGNFPEKELEWIGGRTVYLLYDHDEPKTVKSKTLRPGFDGMARSGLKFENLGATVMCCSWTSYQPPMDIRDLCTLHWKDTDRVWNDINGMLVPLADFRDENGYNGGDTPSSPAGKNALPPYVDSFTEVIDEFRKVYEVTDMFERSVACAFATVISNKLGGDQLWMFLVGPASSGKTTIIESFATAHKYTEHLSKLTSQALISGKATDGDPSILPKLRDKCLFIKDFTAVLALPPGVQEELFGILRDAYDRSVRVQYGNGTIRHYTDLNFTVFAGCTDEIYTKNHSSLGERFLKIEILDPTFSMAAQTRAALMGLNQKANTDNIRKAVYGYVRHLYDRVEAESYIDEDIVDWIVSVSTIVAYLRTSVRRTDGNMAYRPRPEVPARIATQLRKLYLALKMVAPEKDEAWLKMTVEKVAMDSCVGWALEFLLPIIKRKTGITTQEIAEMRQVSANHVSKVLRDLQQIGVIENYYAPNNSGRAGRSSNYWVPEAQFLDLWEEAGISLKATRKYTPSHRAKRTKE